MTDDFRKKTFRGAKIEDMIVDIDVMAKACEESIKTTDDPLRQRFFEGMSIAYTTVGLKLKGAFDYIDQKLFDEIYNQVAKTDYKQALLDYDEQGAKQAGGCSFCGKSAGEVKQLVPGPGVAICGECLNFAKTVLEAGAGQNERP